MVALLLVQMSIFTIIIGDWIRFFSKASVIDKGTLYQVKSAINPSSVPSDPADNMKAAEDFLLLVLHAHIMEAVQTIVSCSNISSLSALSDSIMVSFLMLDKRNKCFDVVFVYTFHVVSLGSLWMRFHDAARGGDRNQVMLYWKILLPIFKESNRRNYSIEALNIQL